MPWTNRVRENSGLRILFLPPPPRTNCPEAWVYQQQPATRHFSHPFYPIPPPPPPPPHEAKAYPQPAFVWLIPRHVLMTFFPFLCCDRVVLARSLRYCQVTVEKLKQTGIEVMWHGKRDNEGSHYCAQCEVRCLTKALFSHTIFSYNTFVISRLLIGGGLSSVRITTLEMTQWWRNLFTSASLVRLSEKL